MNKIADFLEDDVTIDGVPYPKPPAVRALEQQPWGTCDRFDHCRAAIQPSPTGPPVRRGR